MDDASLKKLIITRRRWIVHEGSGKTKDSGKSGHVRVFVVRGFSKGSLHASEEKFQVALKIQKSYLNSRSRSRMNTYSNTIV